MPDLLTYLLQEYQNSGVDVHPEVARFLEWSKTFLENTRPHGVLTVASNYSFVLTNGVSVQVFPTELAAEPNRSISVSIT